MNLFYRSNVSLLIFPSWNVIKSRLPDHIVNLSFQLRARHHCLPKPVQLLHKIKVKTIGLQSQDSWSLFENKSFLLTIINNPSSNLNFKQEAILFYHGLFVFLKPSENFCNVFKQKLLNFMIINIYSSSSIYLRYYSDAGIFSKKN